MATLAPSPAVRSAPRDPVVVPVGVISTPLLDVVSATDGGPLDTTGATVIFFMRPLLSRTPVVNGEPASPIPGGDQDGNNVSYTWDSDDVAIAGEFMGWWGVTPSGGIYQETAEFPIVVMSHGPGFGTPTGVVVDGVGAYMPVTLNAMRADRRFGDRFLQRTADNVKRSVMGQVVSADAEALYDPALQDYLSKRTARALIAPAKDYWARHPRTQSTQGPAEMVSYPDMSIALDALDIRLGRELPQDWRDLQFIVPGLPQRTAEPMPASSLGPFGPMTAPASPDPLLYPPRISVGRGRIGWDI